MSRAFVSERDGFNFCREMSRKCPEAGLRGDCEADECRYVVKTREKEPKKE